MKGLSLCVVLTLAVTFPGSLGADPRQADRTAVYQRYAAFGKDLFRENRSPVSGNGRRCVDCHGSDGDFRDVVERYPRYDRDRSRFVTLEQQIRACLSRRQAAILDELGREEITALVVYLKERARDRAGRPVRPSPQR